MIYFINQNPLVILALALTVLLVLLILVRMLRAKLKPKTKETSLFLKDNFASKLRNLVVGSDQKLANIVPRIEETLITADVGIDATEKLIHKVFEEKKADSPEQAFKLLKTEIQNILTPKTEFHIDASRRPFVIYLVGVNGVGKTTTIGKLACQIKTTGKTVMMVAADTFRAAAVEQLKVWSERNNVAFVGGATNADPSSVIVDGLRSAKAKDIDVVLVDTAGRLHTKSNLMQELQKMARMSEKELGRAPDEIFLVVDAITGQNGFAQAKVFLDAVPVSGVVLTKYDATSKGGIIISIADQTGIPIRYVGLGEKIEDLKKFNAMDFVEKLFSA